MVLNKFDARRIFSLTTSPRSFIFSAWKVSSRSGIVLFREIILKLGIIFISYCDEWRFWSVNTIEIYFKFKDDAEVGWNSVCFIQKCVVYSGPTLPDVFTFSLSECFYVLKYLCLNEFVHTKNINKNVWNKKS